MPHRQPSPSTAGATTVTATVSTPTKTVLRGLAEKAAHRIRGAEGWVDKAWRYGPGTVAAGFLIYWLTNTIDSRILDITAAVNAHVLDTQARQVELLRAIGKQTAIEKSQFELTVLACQLQAHSPEERTLCQAVASSLDRALAEIAITPVPTPAPTHPGPVVGAPAGGSRPSPQP